MKQLITIAITILICFLPQVGFAHSKLVSSHPAANTTVTDKVEEVRLTYNTRIEPGSSFTLTNESGQEIPVTIQMKDKDLIGRLNKPLPNGIIKVDWKIIGADGHVIDGDYQFTYQFKQPKTVEQKQAQPKIEPSQKQPQTTDNTTNQTNLFWIIVGLLIALMLVGVGLLLWKGKKK